MKHYEEGEEKSIADQLLLKEIDQIEPNIGATECVDMFLQPFMQKIQSYLYYSQAEKKIQFLLMKRFLLTAFNNLTEMDLELSNSRVQEAKKKLAFVQKYYDELNFQINKPADITYEAIFLSKQHDFLSVFKEQQSKRKTSELYKQRAKQAESKMKDLKDLSKKYSANSDKHKEIMSQYRKLNGSYTDYVHNMATLRDEANFLSEFLLNFKTSHKEKFCKVLENLGQKSLQTMISCLDGIAYEFDNTLWEEARSSKIIRKLFENAQIEGGFSSKTYLRYYLKNISKDSKNKQHQELRKLLEHLENASSKKIFILGNDTDMVSDNRYFLEGLDKSYSIFGAVDVEKFFLETKRREFDLIILDYNLRNYNSLELIKDVWKKSKKTKVKPKFLLLFFEPILDDVTRAGLLGLKYMLRYDNTQKDKFAQKIQAILN